MPCGMNPSLENICAARNMAPSHGVGSADSTPITVAASCGGAQLASIYLGIYTRWVPRRESRTD